MERSMKNGKVQTKNCSGMTLCVRNSARMHESWAAGNSTNGFSNLSFVDFQKTISSATASSEVEAKVESLESIGIARAIDQYVRPIPMGSRPASGATRSNLARLDISKSVGVKMAIEVAMKTVRNLAEAPFILESLCLRRYNITGTMKSAGNSL